MTKTIDPARAEQLRRLASHIEARREEAEAAAAKAAADTEE